MRRRFALCSMLAFFACAYATLDRLPRSAAQLLRGSAEHVTRLEQREAPATEA